MGMKSPAAILARGVAGLRDLGQLPQQRAVDRRGNVSQRFQSRIGGRGVGNLSQQFLNDFDQQLAIEHPQRFGQRSQRGFLASQLAFDSLQSTRALQVTQRFERRIEERQKNQAAQLIEEQFAVPGPVAFASRCSQPRQQRSQPLQTSNSLQRPIQFRFVHMLCHCSILSVWQLTN